MRYKADHRDEAGKRLLGAIGRGFRKYGYGGVGVDGLAKEAGVTSGAFYGHFSSKVDAFEQAVVAGLQELRDGVAKTQADLGDAWIETFVDFYLGYKRTCDLNDACALQTLTPEVVRASDAVRGRYEAALEEVVKQVAAGLPQTTLDQRIDCAWVFLSLLSGAVTTARALQNNAMSDRVAYATRSAALQIAKGLVD